MSEKNKFIIIDEKPKRGEEKAKRGSPSRIWQRLMGLLTISFLMICGFYINFCILQTDSCPPMPVPSSIELTATSIIATNQWVMQMMTETAIGDAWSTLTPAEGPTITFRWAVQDLPEVTRAAQVAFAQVDILNSVTVRATASGENCYGCEETVVFGPMNTDMTLTVEVESVSDLEAIAEIVIAAADTLSALPVELPAPLGYFDMTLTDGELTGSLRPTFDQINDARADGLTGRRLIAALGGVTLR